MEAEINRQAARAADPHPFEVPITLPGPAAREEGKEDYLEGTGCKAVVGCWPRIRLTSKAGPAPRFPRLAGTAIPPEAGGGRG